MRSLVRLGRLAGPGVRPRGGDCGKLNILLINIRPAMVIKIHQAKLQAEISDRKDIMRAET